MAPVTRPIGSIDAQTFVAALARELAPTTTATVFAVLRSLMQSAMDDEVITANPYPQVRPPRVEPTVIEPLAPVAVAALAAAITPRYELAVLLAAGVGLREGEALGLTAGRVDFPRRRVQVVEELQDRAGAVEDYRQPPRRAGG